MNEEQNLDNQAAPAEAMETELTRQSEEVDNVLAPAETEGQEPEGQKPEVTEEQDDNQHQIPKGLEKRLAKLTKQKYAQQERIDALERQLQESLKAKEEEPDRDDYTDDEWMEILAEKKAKALLQEYQAEQKQRIDSAKNARQAATQWQSKIDTYKEEMPDYEAVVSNADIELPVEVLQTIASSPVGPRMAYHLAKNEQEAEMLQQMDARTRDRYLLKLELKMEDTPVGRPTANQPKAEVTKATPIPRSGGISAATPSEDSLSIDDWMARRRKKLYG